MGNSNDSKPLLQLSIQQLVVTDNIIDETFWSDFWYAASTVDSCIDIWECITQDEVRKLVREYPGNCKTLLTQAMVQLSHIVDSPLPNYFPLLLACVRVLTRVCPVILEPTGEPEVDNQVFQMLWRLPLGDDDKQQQQRLEEEEAAVVQMMSRHYLEEEETAATATVTASTTATVTTASLALRLIDVAFHLLFLPAFTISEAPIGSSGQLMYSRLTGFDLKHMWNSGVGTKMTSANGSNTNSNSSSFGIGMTTDVVTVSSTDYDAARVEVLRLLSVLFCDSIYQKPSSYDVCRSMWLEAATSADASWTGVTLCSLLNSIVGYDPVGWGVPYANLVAADSAGDVMKSSLHVLLVLLDYGLPMSQILSLQQQSQQSQQTQVHSSSSSNNNSSSSSGDCVATETAAAAVSLSTSSSTSTTTATTTGTAIAGTAIAGAAIDGAAIAGADDDADTHSKTRLQYENTIGFNSFRRLLSSIHESKDLGFIFKGFMRGLTQMHYYFTTVFAPASASVLSSLALRSNSYAPLTCDEEYLLLFWRCLQEIPPLFPYILAEHSAEMADLVVILLNAMLIHRKNPSRANYVYLCTFILLHFSAHRSFAVLMNQLYNDSAGKIASSGKLRCISGDLPLFYGSYMDLIVLVLGRVLNSSYDQVPNMVQCWLTILSNISPYCKSLCVVSAMKIASLVDLYTKPEYLISHELHVMHLVLLLEMLNNIVQYQYDGNSSVIYAILRVERSIRRLSSLQYSDLRGIEMVAAAGTQTASTATGTGTVEGAGTQAASSSSPVLERTVYSLSTTTAGNSSSDQQSASHTRSRTSHLVRVSPERFAMIMSELEVPLFTLTSLLNTLLPMITAYINKTNKCEIVSDPVSYGSDTLFDRISGHCSEIQIYNYIKESTLVGLLPRPHAIVVRPFISTAGINVWLSIYMYSVVVIALQDTDFPLFSFEAISLFKMNQLASVGVGDDDSDGDGDVAAVVGGEKQKEEGEEEERRGSGPNFLLQTAVGDTLDDVDSSNSSSDNSNSYSNSDQEDDHEFNEGDEGGNGHYAAGDNNNNNNSSLMSGNTPISRMVRE